ncbi:N-terminal phage integrase SAM-like domain-containing protein, partial [Mycobacteroides abscessus]
MAKLRTLRKEVAEGRATVTGSTTVGRWLRKWIDEIHGPSLRPKAYTDYESIIRLHITPAIGHKRLDVLTAEDVRAMYREMQKTSTRTAAQSHIILRKALGDAMKEGILGKNITDAVAKPKHTPEPPWKSRRLLTLETRMQVCRRNSLLGS